MTELNVCILAAGQGTRMGPFLSTVNKALLPYKSRAIISHIFDKFPPETRFIIAIGHFGQQIKDYIAIAHSDLNIEYVDVSPYSGPNSGPGFSLLSCEKKISDEFMLVCADTLWEQPHLEYPVGKNWLATSQFDPDEFSRYCLVESDENIITKILDKPKKIDFHKELSAFTGIFYIAEAKKFFNNLRQGKKIRNEFQLSDGFSPLVMCGDMNEVKIKGWIDTGTQKNYEKISQNDPQFVFQKKEEFIYFEGSQVLKFFANPTHTKNRVLRQKELSTCTPNIVESKGQFYSYNYIEGESLYLNLDISKFNSLLHFCTQHLWSPISCDNSEALARSFYFNKTQIRIDEYLKNNPGADFPFLKIEELPVNWDAIIDISPVLFHGDLQIDNVIYNPKTQELQLIDWRQDFAGSIHCGDIYYDLAKLLASLKVNYHLLGSQPKILQKRTIELTPVDQYFLYEEALKAFADSMNLSFKRIEEITALIFINIAPLHRKPISTAFWQKGLELLKINVL